MKWKSTDIIEVIQENKNNIKKRQTSPYKMQLHSARISNQNRNSTSREPIITIPRSVLGVGIAIVAFSVIPSIPFVIFGAFCYWIAKQSNK